VDPERPHFSIITPSFNQGEFIRDCIESVRSQAGVSWEHLVIDGGSRDATLGILRESPHLRWTSEPDQGQTDAINKGLRRARGTWRMWLNADDYLLPGALARVAEATAQSPGPRVFYGDCLFVDAQKNLLREKREGAFSFRQLLFYGCFIPSTSCFFHEDVLAGGVRLDPQMKVCMDFDFYIRLAMRGYGFCHIPEPLAAFRWHASNISKTFHARRRAERLQIQRQALRQLKWRGLSSRPFLWVAYQAFVVKRNLRRLAGLRP